MIETAAGCRAPFISMALCRLTLTQPHNNNKPLPFSSPLLAAKAKAKSSCRSFITSCNATRHTWHVRDKEEEEEEMESDTQQQLVFFFFFLFFSIAHQFASLKDDGVDDRWPHSSVSYHAEAAVQSSRSFSFFFVVK